MQLFGFLGPFPGPHEIDSLTRYGDASTGSGAASHLVAPGTDAPGTAWGPSSAARDGVIVVLKGQPIWKTPSATTRDDAQTLLDLYLSARDAVFEHLTGRFAAAIVDRAARRVLLGVDAMGIERLTYAQCGDGLVFGTSAEAVARFPLRSVTLRSQAIFDYLMMHMVPNPDTVFEGVKKLPPGHCAIFADGRLQIRRHWQPRFSEQDQPTDVLARRLHDALRAGVRAAKPDSKTGAFLSGGLDSSTVAGVLSEVSPDGARTFSIGFGYPDYDELPYARIAAKRFRCHAHEYVVTGEDIADSFVKIAHAYDEPFGNSSALPVYYCARFAKANGVDHLLAGDGGDELFAGNSRYVEQRVFELYRFLPRVLRQHALEPLLKRLPKTSFWPIRKARGYVDKASIPLPDRFEMWNLLRVLGVADVLHPDFAARIDTDAPFARMRAVWAETPSDSLLNHMLYYDWYYTLADNDLRKVETMSALAGVRVSYPMLHPDVVDMSTSIPSPVKMPGGKLRHFYKEAMTGFLPNEIILKKKHGFGLPFGLWLQESPRLRELIFGNLTSLRTRNVIRPQFLDRLLTLHGSDDARYYGVLIWVLAMLEQWFQEHRLAP